MKVREDIQNFQTAAFGQHLPAFPARIEAFGRHPFRVEHLVPVEKQVEIFDLATLLQPDGAAIDQLLGRNETLGHPPRSVLQLAPTQDAMLLRDDEGTRIPDGMCGDPHRGQPADGRDRGRADPAKRLEPAIGGAQGVAGPQFLYRARADAGLDQGATGEAHEIGLDADHIHAEVAVIVQGRQRNRPDRLRRQSLLVDIICQLGCEIEFPGGVLKDNGSAQRRGGAVGIGQGGGILADRIEGLGGAAVDGELIGVEIVIGPVIVARRSDRGHGPDMRPERVHAAAEGRVQNGIGIFGNRVALGRVQIRDSAEIDYAISIACDHLAALRLDMNWCRSPFWLFDSQWGLHTLAGNMAER